MPENRSFDGLLARLRAGDDDAAAQIFRRFAHRLIGLARTHLDRQIRRKVDPEDVVQSAYRSFFLRQAQGQFELDNWDSLWSLLAVITVRKCGHKIEYFRAGCRDVRQEVPAEGGEISSLRWEAIAREPTPAEAAVLTETVEQLMDSLDGRHRSIVSLSLQGYAPPEVAEQVGCTERTVQRVLKRVREWLTERAPGPDEGQRSR